MENIQIIRIIIGIIIVFTIILIVTIVYSKKISNKKQIYIRNKGRNNSYHNTYRFLVKVPIIKKYLVFIRKKIEKIDLSDAYTVSKKTIKYAFIAIGTCFTCFVVILIINTSVYFTCLSLITIYIIHNQILYLLIDRVEDQLLIQFEKLLGDIRHHYHEHGMIDEAIYDSIDKCPYEISLHGQRMYEIITSRDVEDELERYYDIVPNKYFKTFLALCYTLQKYGDQSVDGKSTFLANINYLKQEINLEILRRNKLTYLFKSLAIITVSPMFFIVPIEKWAVGNLVELKKYYTGVYGLMAQILIFISILICYQLINNMQRNYNESKKFKSKIEDKLLKIPIISNLIDRLMENNYSNYNKNTKLLNESGAGITLEVFYIKRLIWGCAGFIISLFIIIQGHNITKNNLLNSLGNNINNNNEINEEAKQQLIELEKKYVLNFANQNATYQQIEEELLKEKEFQLKVGTVAIAKDIIRKIRIYDKQYFKWWELVLCLIVGFISFNIPSFMFLFKRRLLQLNREEEVLQYHTLILMLMNIERMSVEDILQWMELFAVSFKQSISRCLNNFEHGDFEALEQLKIDEPFEPFVRIVENLQAATDKISIAQAFDELTIERSYYQEKRKQDNEINTARKGTWGRIIAFTPFSITLVSYLFVPFTHYSIEQFIQYSEQINSVM